MKASTNCDWYRCNPAPANESAWWYDPNGMDWGLPAWRCCACGARNDNLPANMPNINPLRWSGGKFCPNCGVKMLGVAKR